MHSGGREGTGDSNVGHAASQSPDRPGGMCASFNLLHRATICCTRGCAACTLQQVWLALHNLLADGAARSRMDMTEGRVEALLRLKRHFNELLLDQARGRWGIPCQGTRISIPDVTRAG